MIKKLFTVKKGLHLLTRFETLRILLASNKSISRFGDGECSILFEKKGIYFQEYSEELEVKLKNVLLEKNPNNLVCFNNDFTKKDKYRVILKMGRGDKKYDSKESIFYINDVGILERKNQRQFYTNQFNNIKNIFLGKELGEATVFFIGYYFEEYVNSRINDVIKGFQQLFENKRILFVCPSNPQLEPSFSTLIKEGIIQSVKSYDFISIPSNNSFSMYQEILRDVVAKKNKFDLCMIQAGPVATALSHELSIKEGITSYDVGSLNDSVYKIWESLKITFNI